MARPQSLEAMGIPFTNRPVLKLASNVYEYSNPVALKAATLPEPSRPAPVCRSFKYMLRSVKTQAGKSKWAQLMDISFGRSIVKTWCSRFSPK